MESDSERARIPSAMRFSASAASEGVAAPSNSNSRLSPITLSPCRSDPDQWTPRPSKLDADVVRALPLLGLDLENHELGRREPDLLVSHRDRELTRQYAFGELRQIERCRVPAGTTVELRRNRGAHLLPLSRPCERCLRHGRYGLRVGGSRLTHGERLRYDLAPAGRLPRHALQADQLLAADTTGRGVSPSNTLPYHFRNRFLMVFRDLAPLTPRG